MSTRESLIREVEAFCAAANIAETTFGKRAMNDGKFVKTLRTGRYGPGSDTIERVRRYIRAQAPAGFAPRPEPTAARLPSAADYESLMREVQELRALVDQLLARK